jgi:hypothetical protein
MKRVRQAKLLKKQTSTSIKKALNVNSENETFKKKTKFQKSNRSECFD